MKKFILAGMTAAAFAGQSATASAQTVADPAAREGSTQLLTIRNENAQLKAEIAALREQVRLQKERSALNAKLVTGTETSPPAATAPGANYAQPSTAGSPKLSPTVAGAYAADISPVYKAVPTVVTEGGAYVWADGIYDRVHLPGYNVGLRTAAPTAPLSDTGPAQSFDPRLNSGGVRGAIGYAVPGSNFRLELGGSYLTGSGSLSQNPTIPGNLIAATLLNGVTNFAAGCPCTLSGSQRTNYDAWQLNGKAAYDVKYGSATITPSAALFGGSSHADQSISQAFAQTTGLGSTGTYAANTTLRWTDVGVRAGLDAKFALTNMLTVGVGGWVGIAGRSTSLSGADLATFSFGATSVASALTANDTTAVFLANAEAGFAHKLTSNVTFRGFVGVNYDDKVPGVQSAILTGIPAITPSPAGIYYAHELDYYAGLGLLVKFGG